MIKRWIVRISQVLESWQTELKVVHTSQFFIRVLYLFLILNFLRWIPIAEAIWGQDSFVILNHYSKGIERLAFLLNFEPFRSHYWWFYITEVALLLMGFLGLHNFFTRFLVFFLFVNLHNGNYEVSNGGYNLIQQLLFFHIFWFRISERAHNKLASLFRLLHHLSFYGVWLQLSLLYLSTGLFKLDGVHWLDGSAISHVLSIEEYSLPWLIPIAEKNPWWMMLASWITLGYQITFAIAIWFKKWRPYWLILGTIIHLGIAFFVGITDFGFIMVISYLIFLPDRKALDWLERTPYAQIFNQKIYRFK